MPIAFGVDLQRWPDASVKRVRLVYQLDVNEWRGNRSVQLLVEHLGLPASDPANLSCCR